MMQKFQDLFGRKKKMEHVNEEVKGNIFVIKQRCPQNHACPSIRVCPVGALTQKGYGAPTVDMEKCILCKKCIKYCPMRAIAFE